MSDGSLSIVVDGCTVTARSGQSIAAALLAAGITTFRRTLGGMPRGPYCGMGVCYECLVTVDGRGAVRACVTEATSGMVIETGGGSHAG